MSDAMDFRLLPDEIARKFDTMDMHEFWAYQEIKADEMETD